MGSNLESLGPLILVNEPGTVRLQTVLHDARTLINDAADFKSRSHGTA